MAYAYTAPLRDMRFVIEQVLEAPASWAACAAFADLDIETTAAVLEEAAKFASEVLLPINAAGDAQGCTLVAGQVHTPAGYQQAYRAFVQGGWPALPCDPAWGGQGLPMLVDAAVREMLVACNHGWVMYPDLLHGAYETIKAHANDELKQRYLRDVASGECLAAMALTEAQAGSDLGLLATRAAPQADGSLRVSGSKIFISGADHDLSDNIVHLVLCRLPDAPPGSKGISLALVPKLLPDGTRNAWQVDSLEHKLGVHGSATCALRYEGATGWLIGEPNRGLAAMFLMMNSARLHVGLQGLGHQEMAMQNALRYAQERVQMKRPIAEHPAMRRTLLRLQALAQGQRVIAYRAAMLIDEAEHHADADRRQRAAGLAALLTPVVKAFLTHHGFYGASAALQVFGGYGYVREYGIEQSLRDARIAMIYEGTNEIQAIDLLLRKVLGGDGAQTLDNLLADFEAEAVRCDADAELTTFAQALREQSERVREATLALRAAQARDAQAPLRVADDYLMGMGHALLAWAWAASARAARAGDALGEDFVRRKLDVARFGVAWLLPDAQAHWQRALRPDERHLPML